MSSIIDEKKYYKQRNVDYIVVNYNIKSEVVRKSSMCLHDIIVEELIEKKSLAALIYLICHGRELEFEIKGKEYYISCEKSKKYVSLWNNQNEQSFNSVDELIENAKIENRSFLTVWEKASIQTLF